MNTSKGKEKSNKMNECDEKLRILCLHGYRQNAQTFRAKIGEYKIVFLHNCVHIQLLPIFTLISFQVRFESIYKSTLILCLYRHHTMYH